MQTVFQDTGARMFRMQPLSVAVQRGNAACILGTIVDDDFSTEFFIIRLLYMYYSIPNSHFDLNKRFKKRFQIPNSASTYTIVFANSLRGDSKCKLQ